MILLSSYGMQTELMRDRFKNYLVPTEDKVLLIADAGNKYTSETEIEGLVAFGYNKENITVFNSNENDYGNFDVIYIAGGDTFKLLDIMQTSGFISKLKEYYLKGATIIGVSAGAYLLTRDLKYVKTVEEDRFNLTSYIGVGLIKDIICHYDALSYSDVIAMKSKIKSEECIYINNTDIIQM